MKETAVNSVTQQGVWIEYFGEKTFLPVDEIVIAVGAAPILEEVDVMIEKRVKEVYRIGDKVKAGGILEAVKGGYEIGRKI
jgi:hypothetical protein